MAPHSTSTPWFVYRVCHPPQQAVLLPEQAVLLPQQAVLLPILILVIECYVCDCTQVQNFVDKGYVRGKTIVGAPYDWRYSPSKPYVRVHFCDSEAMCLTIGLPSAYIRHNCNRKFFYACL